ncbi:MAG: alanine racemase, partial [Bacteroidales bacterium]|nr:alanine racemase [Bacteroidales bacterium]
DPTSFPPLINGAPENSPIFGEVTRVAQVAGGRCPDAYPHILFCGLMGMASHTDDEERIRGDFARIKALFDECRKRSPQLTEFTELSIGMSDDWRLALDYGATIIRIGTAIFGSRL